MNRNQLAQTIEHTLLKPEASEQDILRLCNEAAEGGFFAVCVNPCRVEAATRFLQNFDAAAVAVCSVVGFPLGASASIIKMMEAEHALMDGAREIDMVMNIGYLYEQRYKDLLRDILEVKSILGPDNALKVIIETAVLSPEQKRNAAALVADSGAEFVKTSTGTIKTSTGETAGATIDDIKLLRQIVGGNTKIKASGGIETTEKALALIEAGADRLGTSKGVQIIAGMPLPPLTTSKLPPQFQSLKN